MSQAKFEQILRGEPLYLDSNQLTAFKVYCSSLSLKLQQWIGVSLTLFKVDRQLCNQFLIYIEKHEMGRTSFKDFIHQNAKIMIYNNLAGLNLGKAVRETNKEEMEKYMNDARKFLNASEKVRMTTEKSIIMTRAYIYYYSGEVFKASNIFSKSFEEANNSLDDRQANQLAVTCTLGLAQTHFLRKNYQKALELYKKSLQMNKTLPPKARLGMAYCFYNLNKFQLAQFAFLRIIKLDPKCVQAYIGLAVISDRKQSFDSYFKYLVLAYQINPNHPLVLIHLAEHYLFQSNQQKTVHFCNEGLKSIENLPKFLKCEGKIRNDYEEYKARFNNILGQLYHMSGDYQKCLKYYLAAQDKGIQYNSINLCQAYMHPNYQNYIFALKAIEECCENIPQREAKLLGEVQKTMGYLKSKLPGKKIQDPTMFYKESIKYNKNQYQVYIEYANLIMESKKTKALELLLTAKSILEKSNKPIRVQLLNNIAVLLLETGQFMQSKNILISCIELNNNTPALNHEDQIKNKSLFLVIKMNLALVYDKLNILSQSLKILDEIISTNKYYIDAYIHKSSILYRLGMSESAIAQLDTVIQVCQSSKAKMLRQDRILSMKGHLYHLMSNDSKARDIFKLLSKTKDIYSQFYEISIDYETIIRKQTELSVLKEFLRPKRQFCVKYCHDDPNGVFGYMVLILLLLTDKKIGKTQGLQFFTQIRDAQFQLPLILYNMGVFLYNFQDYDLAINVLSRYKQRTGCKKVDQLISLICLIQGKYDDSIKLIKKNVLSQPRNMKYRYQLAYASEKKSQSIFNEKERTTSQMKSCYDILKICSSCYFYLSRININEYLKGHQNIQLKEKMRIVLSKIKQASQDRKHYVKSKIQYYQKTQKQLQRRQKQEQQARRITLERLKQAKLKENSLIQQLMYDEDDQEKTQKQIEDEKRKRLLQKMREREQQMNNAFKENQQKAKQFKQEKKKSKSSKKPKKKQIIKQKQSSDSFIYEEKPKQQEQNYKRTKKYDQGPRDNKKLKRIKVSQDSQSIKPDSQQQASAQEQDDQDLKKYMIDQ